MEIKNSAVILARVSSKSQEDEGYSLDSQLKLLEGYCQQNNLKVVKVYKIAETASKDQSRKVFSELLSYISKNGIYNLAVEKTDRLTRNLKDAVAVDDWLNDNPDRMLHAVKENLKVHKEARSDVKFMWNIHLAVAKKYTDNLREEAMKGWAEKLAQGHMPSRPPAGYMTAIQNGKRIHVPDPHFAPIVQRGFELYLEPQQTALTVLAFWTQSGIRTHKGNPVPQSQVYKILQNTYYMGIISFNNETYPGAHEPLISKEMYKAVQDKMHSKRPAKLRRLDPLLKGIMVCGYCSKTITWEKQRGHLYGACQRDLVDCKINKYVREEIVHDTIMEKLENLISPSPEIVQWLVNQLDSEYRVKTQTIEDYKTTLQTRLTRLENMLETLYDDKLSGEITIERYTTKKTDINKQIETVKDDLGIANATVATKHKNAIDLIELTQRAKEQYMDESMSHAAKRSILTELFDEVVLTDNSVSVKFSQFTEQIAETSEKTRQFLKEGNMVNRTIKKDPLGRGQFAGEADFHQLIPLWQG